MNKEKGSIRTYLPWRRGTKVDGTNTWWQITAGISCEISLISSTQGNRPQNGSCPNKHSYLSFWCRRLSWMFSVFRRFRENAWSDRAIFFFQMSARRFSTTWFSGNNFERLNFLSYGLGTERILPHFLPSSTFNHSLLRIQWTDRYAIFIRDSLTIGEHAPQFSWL